MKSFNTPTVIKIKSYGNDLFADASCSCPDPKYAEDAVLSKIFKTKLKFSGYNDGYFFNEVNKEPKNCICHNCGQEYLTQWRKDGFYIEPIKQLTTN